MIDGLVDRRDLVVMVAADEMPWRYLEITSGLVLRHCASASGHRPASAHPVGRPIGLGISPSSVIALDRLSAGSGNNTEASKPAE